MPIKMGDTVQSVVIGDIAYVGGGWAGKDSDQCTVMKFNLQQGEWTKLPQYSAKLFAITSFDNQLVLVGGYNIKTRKQTNQIAVLVSGDWTHPYPPMNTARSSSAAVSFNNNIIVAGGWDCQRHISSVEVLDVASRRWYTAGSLLYPRSTIKSTLIGHMLYLMGGLDLTGQSTKVVHKFDLNELITSTVSKQATPTFCQVIEDTPLKCSAPLNVGGSLLAVGGYDGYLVPKPSSSIHLYQPDTRRWVKVGDLPTARYYCTCSVLPSGEIIVAGGQTPAFISTVDFLSISDAHMH